MAIYVLDRILMEEGSDLTKSRAKKAVARRFKINSWVLDRIGEVSSLTGTGLSARKAGTNAHRYLPEGADYNDALIVNAQLDAWLDSAIAAMILHLVRLSSNDYNEFLTKESFPQLPQPAI